MKHSKTNLKNRKSVSFITNKVKLTIISSCFVFMALTSCGGNDDNSNPLDCGNGLWTLSVQSELNTWLAATQAYGADPTPVNCQKNKSAGQAYITALDKIKTCVPTASIANFEKALKEAKDEINAISC